MKDSIRRKALELGFDACRFTSAAPPASYPQFQSWLSEGMHGTMSYLERQSAQRGDPRLILPGAQSIIVLALNYATQETPDEPSDRARRLDEPVGKSIESHRLAGPGLPTDPPRVQQSLIESIVEGVDPGSLPAASAGWIARYARYRDYHLVLGDKLRQLGEFVVETMGSDVRLASYVDAGPVLERDLAQRAGLGFIGRHTNLISRQLGNWVLLCELITTASLDPDPPETNHCGKCRRCLDVCPTQAITAPFRLDARRCLSYWSIEHKGSIPLEYRKAMGRRIFGCDDCLAVCPWNRFAQTSHAFASCARPDLANPDLRELLQLDAAAFRARFGGTPLQRLKRERFLRNACVAAGNSWNPELIPLIEKLRQQESPLVQEHAIWAIAQLAGTQIQGAAKKNHQDD
jgi:epoxyqueuosine reductase